MHCKDNRDVPSSPEAHLWDIRMMMLLIPGWQFLVHQVYTRWRHCQFVRIFVPIRRLTILMELVYQTIHSNDQ